MKGSELMIGDLVAVSNTPLQIAALGTVKAGFLDAKGEMFYHYYDNIEPIPLTAEILEKNGWIENPDIPRAVIYYTQKFKDGDDGWLWDFDVRIDCDPYGDYHLMHNGVSFCYVNYVHALQHVLKLCGIDKEIEL